MTEYQRRAEGRGIGIQLALSMGFSNGEIKELFDIGRWNLRDHRRRYNQRKQQLTQSNTPS